MSELARRTGPVSRVRVAEHDATGEHPREDAVAAEEPLEIRIAWPGSPAQRAWVTMRTPGHDFELAAGWVVHEGLVPRDALSTVAYCTDVDLTPEQEFNVVTVTASQPVDLEHRHAGLSSGSSACGVCGRHRRRTSYAGSRRCCARARMSSAGPAASMRPGCSPPTVTRTSYARTWGGTTRSTR